MGGPLVVMRRLAMNNIVSLSGGKDSTAMLLMMLEHNEPIHSVVFFNTGWEFSEMIDHIKVLEKYLMKKYSLKVWTVHPRLPFEYELFHKAVRKQSGPNKGKIHRVGQGWPAFNRRWCTDRKVRAIKHLVKNIENPVQCIGYTADEEGRGFNDKQYEKRFPLMEYGVTEADALQYCYEKGFDWGGLYKIFDRVSCFCCPLKGVNGARKIRTHFPDLWGLMLKWDKLQPEHNRGFVGFKTVHDLENKFAEEDRQIDLFPEMKIA